MPFENNLPPHLVGVNPEYNKPEDGTDETDGYVGVSPEYRNAANDTDVPYAAKGDDTADLVKAGVNNQFELEDAVKAAKDDDGDKTPPKTTPAKTPAKTPAS